MIDLVLMLVSHTDHLWIALPNVSASSKRWVPLEQMVLVVIETRSSAWCQSTLATRKYEFIHRSKVEITNLAAYTQLSSIHECVERSRRMKTSTNKALQVK